ncbi:MAG: hypothetical protein ACH350_09945 [Parachlamydiaceae bacterium]
MNTRLDSSFFEPNKPDIPSDHLLDSDRISGKRDVRLIREFKSADVFKTGIYSLGGLENPNIEQHKFSEMRLASQQEEDVEDSFEDISLDSAKKSLKGKISMGVQEECTSIAKKSKSTAENIKGVAATVLITEGSCKILEKENSLLYSVIEAQKHNNYLAERKIKTQIIYSSANQVPVTQTVRKFTAISHDLKQEMDEIELKFAELGITLNPSADRIIRSLENRSFEILDQHIVPKDFDADRHALKKLLNHFIRRDVVRYGDAKFTEQRVFAFSEIFIEKAVESGFIYKKKTDGTRNPAPLSREEIQAFKNTFQKALLITLIELKLIFNKDEESKETKSENFSPYSQLTVGRLEEKKDLSLTGRIIPISSSNKRFKASELLKIIMTIRALREKREDFELQRLDVLKDKIKLVEIERSSRREAIQKEDSKKIDKKKKSFKEIISEIDGIYKHVLAEKKPAITV